MKKVWLALIKDDDGLDTSIYINATHQGSLQDVASWMAPMIKGEIESDEESLKYWAESIHTDQESLQRSIQRCNERLTAMRNVQTLLAQEKLDDAVTAFNNMGIRYSVEMGEEPVGS